MPKLSMSDAAQHRITTLLDKLLLHGCDILTEPTPASQQIELRWCPEEESTSPHLLVKAPLNSLTELVFEQPPTRKLTQQIHQDLYTLKTLGLLQDNRIKTQGSPERHFTLWLWYPSPQRNLHKFPLWWEQQKQQRTQPCATATLQPYTPKNAPRQSPADLYIPFPKLEAHCRQEILQPGSLTRIKAPRRMGKTQLLNRLITFAQQQNYTVIPLNFFKADQATLSNLERLLYWFCRSLSHHLKAEQIQTAIAQLWDPNSSSNDNCTVYFEQQILEQDNRPILLALDNVDRLFQHPEVSSDFFALLRSWYEDARYLAPWQKLRLIFAHATDGYTSLNINHSPFNVGLAVEIPEFSAAQTTELAKRHDLNWSTADTDRLMALVGGHPYLISHALQALSQVSVPCPKDLLALAPTEEGIYRTHLRELETDLRKDALLIPIMQTIIQANNPIPIGSREAFRLYSMGLIRWRGDEVEPHCELYRKYFAQRLH